MIDLHNDLITADNLSIFDKLYTIDNDKNLGVKVCYSIFLNGKNEKYLNNYAWAKSIDCLSIEDIGGIDNINEILPFNPKFVTLTWNYNNEYAGGAKDDGNLTEKGCDVIDFLNCHNIAIDLSHLNRKSFENVIKRGKRVLVSHTCFDKINQNKRNLTDEQIDAVIEKGGVIGLCFYSNFLTNNPRATIDDLVRHIDYFCSNYSFRNLAIGADYFGMDNGIEELDSYSGFHKIEKSLSKLGYSFEVIDAILNTNAKRFLD